MSVNDDAGGRRTKRIYVKIPVSVIVNFQGTPVAYEMISVDISLRGVRVRGKIPLVPGEHVKCVVAGSHDQVPSRVVWSASAGPQQKRESGIEFLQPIDA
jgi:hypothetical protein